MSNTGAKSTHSDVKLWCRLVAPPMRVLIRENVTERVFSLTIEDLTKQDEGTYRCVIVIPGIFTPNAYSSRKITVIEDATVQGPAKVLGQVSASKSIACQYSKVYTESVKYWCKESGVNQCSSTVDTKDEDTEGRTQIRDNPSSREFLITIRNLTLWDTGQYRCGVRGPSGHSDKWAPVYLHVDPGTHKISTTSKSLVESSSAPGTSPTTKQESSTFTAKYPSGGVEKMSMSTKLVISFGVLLLLCVLTTIIMHTIKRKARRVVADQSKEPSGALELIYTEVVTKKRTEEPSNSLYSNLPFHEAQQQSPPEDRAASVRSQMKWACGIRLCQGSGLEGGGECLSATCAKPGMGTTIAYLPLHCVARDHLSVL
ncbi:hypothetical protein AAFF_G00060180 [Aldrovandia affinis]|uniref:Ig-like domain-containing protein n=1 Tax=Aldrovandia affinis TaxID=143900 RepID=A0AAD7S0D5_9TELE|nr:hypothetical protein AAFF_G00060180 [Aldrovandia affinis]